MLLQLIRSRTSHDNSPIALISNFSLFPIFVRERIKLPCTSAAQGATKQLI